MLFNEGDAQGRGADKYARTSPTAELGADEASNLM